LIIGWKAAVVAWEIVGAVDSVETSGNCCLKSANSSSSGFRVLVLQVAHTISKPQLRGRDKVEAAHSHDKAKPARRLISRDMGVISCCFRYFEDSTFRGDRDAEFARRGREGK
jgi:hypothetical protein